VFNNYTATLPELDEQSALTKMRMKKRLGDGGGNQSSGNTSAKVGELDTQKTTANNTAT